MLVAGGVTYANTSNVIGPPPTFEDIGRPIANQLVVKIPTPHILDVDIAIARSFTLIVLRRHQRDQDTCCRMLVACRVDTRTTIQVVAPCATLKHVVARAAIEDIVV
ncbi:hypothetical protein ASF32_14575 [Methylobacterium sp. Leaf91]|nr:hypothetical protein ASF24_04450 [Methylobacterium sp. Leaf86]KQO99076.1 hypothetical protein ASF32_14575 [Methylobacterium sp. Leaf91]